MKLLHAFLVCLFLWQSLVAAPSYPTGKLVLADYTPHHTTRPIGNGLDLWRWDGNALSSSASVKRRISNGDLIGPDGRNQIPCTVYPAVGMQSEEDEDYVEYQILVAKAARIDGFMIEWNSPGKASNLVLRTVAERLGFLVGAVWQADQTLDFKVTPTFGASPTSSQWNTFLADYSQKLREELYNRPTAPRIGDRPLLLFFGWGCPGYNAQDLSTVRMAWGADTPPLVARTHLGLPDAYAAGNFRQGLNLVDGYYPWSTPGSALSEPSSPDSELAPLIAANTHDSYYTGESMLAYRERWIGYTKAFESQGFPLRMGGVMSHGDNRPCGGWGGKMFYVARKDGETARKQWALYKNERANLDAVFIVTWNDWTEGTIVEPSVERGLQDVTIIEEGASGFKDLLSDPAGLPLPKRLFDLRKGHAQLVRLGFPAAGAKARLDSVADQIAIRQFSLAQTAIEQEETRLQSLVNRIVAQPPSVATLVAADTEKTATTSVPVWMNLPSAVDVLMSTLRCDAELTWEWLDADFSTYKIYTNSSGTASNDAIAEIIGSGTGEWKTAKIRVYDTNCWFTRDAISGAGKAVLKVTGEVKFRNMVFTATRKDLPPVIGMGPVGGSISSGAALNLSVEAGGTGTTTYQWRKNGAAIQGGTAATLGIQAATSADAGSYDCIVSVGTASVTSAAAVVNIIVPPTVDQQPVSRTVNPGTLVAFSVTASGTAPLTYQWRKDGTNITGANLASFSITSASSTDAGSYDVIVTNAAGSVTSSAAVLAVNTPVSITAQPVSRTVNPGTLVAFSVTASGTAPLTYQWRKNGTNITGATLASFSIASASSTDAGYYDVIVTNAAGSVTSSAASLEINAGSNFEFLIQPEDVHFLKGSACNVSLKLGGQPGDAPDSWQLFAVSQETPLLSGTLAPNSEASVRLPASVVGGDYFFRVSRKNPSGVEATKNTRIFHAKVYSWSDLAGNYEALLLSANPTAQDGVIYRGAVTLSVTRTGVVSGRIQYTEALPVADSPLPSIRNYVPVVHSVMGRFSPVAGKPELWRLGPKGYPRSANTREEVTLEWNLSVTPPAVTAIVTDNVSGAPGLDRGAWESRATCRRVLPSLLQLSAAQKQVVGRHVAGGDFSRSETGSPPAYLLLQVTSSGRLLWSSRRPGHSGSGASTLAEEDEHLFSAKFYEGQSISLTAARGKLSHSWAGRLVLSQLPPNARWSASVGSTELPSALELQSSCLSASGKTIAFVPGDSNWSVIGSVQFAEGNGCDWKMASEVSDFIRTRPPMQFALQPTPAATAGPPTEQRWGATLFSRDAIKLLTPSNSEVAPPLTLFQLNRVSAEFTGIQSQSGMRPRGRLRGFVTDSSTRPKVHGLGWIETGELPFVTVRHWSLQTE